MSTSISYVFSTRSLDYTYDNNLLEIVDNKIQTKDLRPENATFYINYNNDLNGNWGNGYLEPIYNNNSDILNGKLDLAHDDIRYIDYNANGNANSQQQGCIIFRIILNYSNAPDNQQDFIYIAKEDGNPRNLILIRHLTSGKLYLFIYDENGNPIISDNNISWDAIKDQEYEFKLNFDITNGETKLFIDNVQYGTYTETGIRSSDIGLLRFGTNNAKTDKSNFYIEDFIYFNMPYLNNINWENIETRYAIKSNVIFNKKFYTDNLRSFQDNKIGNVEYNISINSINYAYNTSWNKSTELNTNEEINNNSTSLFEVNSYLRGEVGIEAFLLSDGIEPTQLEQIDLTFDFVGEPPELNTQVYCGFINKLNGINLKDSLIKVKTDLLLSNKLLIVDKEIKTNVKENGYWKIEIKYGEVKPTKLYWNIDEYEFVTEFSTKTNYFLELKRLG